MHISDLSLPLLLSSLQTQYPRVNGTMMQQYLGRSVWLVGEVVSSSVESAKVRHILTFRCYLTPAVPATLVLQGVITIETDYRKVDYTLKTIVYLFWNL